MRSSLRVRTLVPALALAAGIGLAGVSVAPVDASAQTVAPSAVRRVASGWIAHWRLDDGLTSTLAHAKLFRDVSLYWYSATRHSTVVEQEPGAQPDQTVLDQAVTSLQAKGIPVYLAVNDDGFNASTMARLLQDRKRRHLLERNLVETAVQAHADGIDVDFESMNFGAVGADRTSVKVEFPAFLEQLRSSLHAKGLRLSVALPARTGPHDPGWEVFDYRAIASTVDRVRVMAYDYHAMSGPPGPIAPISWVADVARFSAARFGARMSLGLPSYGYTWYRRTVSGNCPASATSSTYGSAQSMLDIAQREGVKPRYVPSVAEFTFRYVKAYRDGVHRCRAEREVWFEDARSVKAKLAVVRRHHIRSVAFWVLGAQRAATWRVLRAYAKS